MVSRRLRSRKADELDELLDVAWKALEKWKTESDARAHDVAPSRRHGKRKPKFNVADFDDQLDRLRKYRESLNVDQVSRNPPLNKIMRVIGEKRWNKLAEIFLDLPNDFELYVRRPREVHKAKLRMAKQCRNLAALIASDSLDNLTDFYESPFNGLVAKQVFTIDWFLALQALRYSRPTVKDALNIANKCFYGLYLVDASRTLVRMLRGYADALDIWKPAYRVKVLHTFAYGKLDKEEFVKRAVFFLLAREMNLVKPLGCAPNQATAAIVNIVLRLRGKSKVTANNITQMNKKTRTKYYKELETHVNKVKAPE